MSIAIDGLVYYLGHGEISNYIGGHIQSLCNNEENNIYLIKDREINSSPTIPDNIKVEELYINRSKDDFRSLTSFIKSKNIKLYHCTNNGFSLSSKEKGAKKILTSFNNFISLDNESYFNQRYAEKFYNSIQNAIEYSDLITTSSEALKKVILSSYNIEDEKVMTLSPVVNEIYTKTTSYMSSTYLKSKFNFVSDFILYTGDIHPRKRLDEFLEIFFKLSSSNNKLYFVILSNIDSINYSYYLELKSLINILNLEEKVIFISQYTELDKLHFYNKAKCLVDFSNFDYCNVTLYEARNCNTPIICSDISIHREILNDYPLYLDITLPYVDEIIESYINDNNNLNCKRYSNNKNKLNSFYSKLLR